MEFDISISASAHMDSYLKYYIISSQRRSAKFYFQDNTIVAFFSQRSGSVETFGSNDFISYEIECSGIADSGIERTVSNLLGAT